MSYHVFAPQGDDQLSNLNEWAHQPLKAGTSGNSTLVRHFLNELSKLILKDSALRVNSDLIALGYWLRPANINAIVEHWATSQNILRKPVGTVVHYSPNNVDTLCFYSWICGLLAGNRNIVRMGTDITDTQRQLFILLNKLLSMPRFHDLAISNLFVTYAKDAEINAQVSAVADVRAIWGGDDSVRAIKNLPTKPRCRDISFADRYSISLINGDAVNSEHEYKRLAVKLWQDIKPYAQQACSSPKVIYWLGSERNLNECIEVLDGLVEKSSIQLQTKNEQLVQAQLYAGQHASSNVIFKDRICIVELNDRQIFDMDIHQGYLMLLVIRIKDISELADTLEEKVQTMTYFGLSKEELRHFIAHSQNAAIDRVVPVGRALEFSPNWDGVNLLEYLSRGVCVE